MLVVVSRAQTADSAAIRDSTVGQNMGTGAGAGAVAGALWGLTCGPFFIICAPIGALMGSGVGMVAGAAVGVATSLPQETATQLSERLTRLRQSHDPLDALRANLNERARKHWALTAEPSNSTLTVELQNLFLTSTRDQRIGLVMQVRVSVSAEGAQPNTPAPNKVYGYVGPLSSLAVWLDERNDFAQTSLRSASEQIAAQIISELVSN